MIGNKYRNLICLSDLCEIPPSRCLTTSAFKVALKPTMRAEIMDILAELRRNRGFGMAKACQAISSILDNLSVPATLRPTILRAAAEVTEGWMHPAILRSSSSSEDSERTSAAGVYLSISDIWNAEQLLQGVVRCWAASFGLVAIAHRLRLRQYEIDPLPALIIQRYIANPSISGVCSSVNPVTGSQGILIEYSYDGPSAVESGEGVTTSLWLPHDTESADRHTDAPLELLNAVASLTISARRRLGREVEIEWCAVGRKLYLLQARPLVVELQRSLANSRRPEPGVYDL